MKFNLRKILDDKRTDASLNILLVFLLLITPVFIYLTGGTQNVYVHLMYIPIIIAARSKKVYFVVIISVLAGLFVGPFMPLDVRLGTMQSLNSWVFRGLMYLFVGLVVFFLNQKYRRDISVNQMILSNITEGVCVVDEENQIVYVNKIFADIHDLNPEDIRLKNVYDFIYMQYSDMKDTITLRKLLDAIENRTDVTELMIPREKNKFGEIVTEYEVKAVKDEHVNSSIIIVKDIENRLNYERNLLRLSYIDSLTGLNNRRAIEKHIHEVESNSLPLGILFVDIDGIKFINDSFGHQKGDQMIIELAYIVKNSVKNKGVCARYDGDTFLIIISNATNEIVDKIVDDINKSVSKIIINSLQMSVSCGYSIMDSIENIDKAMGLAENNMYIDKNSSNNSMRSNPIDTIINTLHEKDAYSEQHSRVVSNISANLARALNLPGNQIKEIQQAALLHDIGKIIVPINILQKEGSLTDDEYSKMKEHSEIGYRLLSNMKSINEIPALVLSHHERWDGSGYPHQMKAEEIPIGSRIIGIADAYNAMTTDRTYRKKMTKEAALKEIIENSGTQFDPSIIEIFKDNFNDIVQ